MSVELPRAVSGQIQVNAKAAASAKRKQAKASPSLLKSALFWKG